VITSLQEIDAIVLDEIDDPVLLREAPRPRTCGEIFERLRFSNSVERIAKDRFYHIERAQRDTAIRFDPMAKVFAKLRLIDGDA
jgi:hypothetical protein